MATDIHLERIAINDGEARTRLAYANALSLPDLKGSGFLANNNIMKHPAGWSIVTRRHPGSASVCAAVACGGVICGCRANLLGLPPGRTLRLKAWKPAGTFNY